MRNIFIALTTVLSLLLFINNARAQGVAINKAGIPADSSALLDVNSTVSPFQGTLITRLTTAQRNTIVNPAQALLIYNTTTKCFEFYENGAWQTMFCACNPPPSPAAAAASGTQQTGFNANWNTSTGATGYHLDVSTDAGFSSFVTGYNDLNVGNVTVSPVTGLSCNTTYYYRVHAYNSCGNSAYSNTITAVTSPCSGCGTPFTDVRDGQVYNTVQIGTQCWIAQNLNIGTRINIGGSCMTNNGVIEKLCYNDDPANCTTYGGIYQWAEAVQYYNGATNTTSWSSPPSGNLQGICPTGWHLPTEAEMVVLENYLGGAGVAGGALKETGFVHWLSPNTGATNSSNFTALGTGTSNVCVLYEQFNQSNCLWTATQTNSTGARFRFLRATASDVLAGDAGKSWGYSVRCIKD